MLGQGVWAKRSRRPLPLARGGPALADPITQLLGIEAHQRHQGLSTAQQTGQGIDAFAAKQGLHPIAQDLLHQGEHLPLNSGALALLQQGHHAKGLQERQEVIQHGPCVEPIDPIDQLVTVQPPGDPRIIAPGHVPTHPFRQVLCDRVACLAHDSPPSADHRSAREESEPQIKGTAYVGTSKRADGLVDNHMKPPDNPISVIGQ
jgi:hypothetical protein